MSKILFNEHQRKQLESNPNVASVSDRAIQYKPEFKIRAVQENLGGKWPSQIFIENGFDLDIIGAKKAKSSLSRWRRTYNTYGETGLLEERRGKGSTGRPSTKDVFLPPLIFAGAPFTTKPAGRKKLVCAIRSINCMTIAASSGGNASSNRNAVTNWAQTKNGSRIQVSPLARS